MTLKLSVEFYKDTSQAYLFMTFLSSDLKIDFDIQKVFAMPGIETMIFSYVNFDKCRKEIIRYEEARNNNSMAKKHPKEVKKEALDVLRCQS